MPLTGPALGALRILLVEDSPEDAELMSEQISMRAWTPVSSASRARLSCARHWPRSSRTSCCPT